MYEVEMKFPLVEPSAVLERLAQLHAAPRESIRQSDTYLKHPSRNFAETDEALRIRCVKTQSCVETQNCVTYKGPKTQAEVKTRREIEVPFAPGAPMAGQLLEMCLCLGFQPVRQVLKNRVPYSLSWQGWDVELAYDVVDGLGAFLEIELLAEGDQVDAAQRAVRQLADELGLANSERRSYLSMLLERETNAPISDLPAGM